MEWDDDPSLFHKRSKGQKVHKDNGKTRPFADDSNWREKIQNINMIKMDDASKGRYLESIQKYGKKNLAAAASGVTEQTVKKHMSVDPEFSQAVEHSLGWHRDNRARKLEMQAINGYEETIIGGDGTIGSRKRYETQLRVLVLKSLDRELYGEQRQVDVNLAFTGGALVIPATLNQADWEKQFDEMRAENALPEASERINSEVKDAEFEPATPASFNK